MTKFNKQAREPASDLCWSTLFRKSYRTREIRSAEMRLYENRDASDTVSANGCTEGE